MSEQDLPRSYGDLGLIAAVDAYLEEYFGRVAGVYHDEESDLVHIDVHYVEPTQDRPYFTLMTSGMAEKPMYVDEGLEEWRYCELVLHVTPNWKPWSGGRDDGSLWAVELIRGIAAYPHEQETWLGPGHSLPLAFAPGHPLSHYGGVLLLPGPISAPQFFSVADGREVGICTIVPLYPKELKTKLEEGVDGIRELAIRAGLTPKALRISEARRKPMHKSTWFFGKS